jgi:hypothetical protein
MTRILVALAMLLGSLAPLHASAQAASTASPYLAPTRPQPAWRLDVTAPSFGIGGFWAPAADYARTIFTWSLDVRMVAASGHGVMVRFAEGADIWGGGDGVELDWVGRVRLAGDDHFGLALDGMVGPTIAYLNHNEGTVPRGVTCGGNANLSLDFRAYGFVVSLAAQYRILMPAAPAPNGGPTGPEHALTATLGLGFGFWGY